MQPLQAPRSLSRDGRWLQLLLLLVMFVFYAGILSHGGRHFTAPGGFIFNSMLAHMAQGRFDIDPGIIGIEGFLRNGRVYSYWGIFCALLRLPLLLLHRLDTDISVLSCAVGVTLAGFLKLRTLLLVRRHVPLGPASNLALGLMMLYILFGGGEIGFLRASVYQEVDFWAAVFGSLFVYFAIKGLLARSFSVSTLAGMSAASGLALLTRVSVGIGLCVAIALLLLVLVLQAVRAGEAPRPSALWQTLRSARILVPVLVLAFFLGVTAAVNYLRWGNPFTFANYYLYLGNLTYPERVLHTRVYGLFNLVRLPFGLLYFFFPIWALHAPGGGLFFEAFQRRTIDAVELPPGSFFLTDLLPCLFIVLLAVQARRHRRSLAATQAAALAVGLSLPCLLMLTAITMAYRYRMDFYPLMDLLAFLGLYLALADAALQHKLARNRLWLAAAAGVSILSSFFLLYLYRLSEFGPSTAYLRAGIVAYYRSRHLH